MKKKLIFWGIGAVAVIVVVILIVNLWHKITQQIKNSSVVREQQGEARALINDRTLSQSQINSYVSKLYTAMKGMGTDENAIYDIFEHMENLANLTWLMSEFGTKDGETLQEWLYGELNESEINHLNQILTAQNINYKF